MILFNYVLATPIIRFIKSLLEYRSYISDEILTNEG